MEESKKRNLIAIETRFLEGTPATRIFDLLQEEEALSPEDAAKRMQKALSLDSTAAQLLTEYSMGKRYSLETDYEILRQMESNPEIKQSLEPLKQPGKTALESVRQAYREDYSPHQILQSCVVQRFFSVRNPLQVERFLESSFRLSIGEAAIAVDWLENGITSEELDHVLGFLIEKKRPQWDEQYRYTVRREASESELNSLREDRAQGKSIAELLRRVVDEEFLDPFSDYLLADTFSLAFGIDLQDAALFWDFLRYMRANDSPMQLHLEQGLERAIESKRDFWQGQRLNISKRRITGEEKRALQQLFLNGKSPAAVLTAIEEQGYVSPPLDALLCNAILDAFAAPRHKVAGLISQRRSRENPEEMQKLNDELAEEFIRRKLWETTEGG